MAAKNALPLWGASRPTPLVVAEATGQFVFQQQQVQIDALQIQIDAHKQGVGATQRSPQLQIDDLESQNEALGDQLGDVRAQWRGLALVVTSLVDR